MDVLNRIARQFQELFSRMTPSQRGTLIVVPLLVVAAFAMLLWSQPGASYTALSWGKVFSTDELMKTEQALIEANLTGFRREGQRIMVPAGEADRYNAALLEFDAMPADMGAELLRKFENLGPFSTDRQRQDMKEALLLQELQRMIMAVPDIEHARVGIASSGRPNSWSRKNHVTANVTVRPRAGRELSQRLVTSLRAAVSSMVPDLKPSDVTIFDVVNAVSYTGESTDDPFNSGPVNRIRELTRQYEQQIQKDLSYIPGVGVTVHVDVDNLKSSVTRSQVVDPKKSADVYSSEFSTTDNVQQRPPKGEAGLRANQPGALAAAAAPERTRQLNESGTNAIRGVSFEVTEKALIAAMPKAVQVSVKIPRDYYREIADQRTAAGEKDPARTDALQIEQDVLANVQKSVARLIPTGSPVDAITVTSFERVETNAADTPIVWSIRITELVRQWGGPAGMVLLALAALVILRRQMKSLPAEASSMASAAGLSAGQTIPGMPGAVTAPATMEEIVLKDMPKRELIQNLARDNPEMTANVIGKWLQAAK